MLTEFRVSLFPKLRTKRYRYIVIHDVECMYTKNGVASIVPEDKINTISRYRTLNLMYNKYFDYNYHFVCEKRSKDYEIVFGRPLNRLCEYDDIEDQYKDSIHIGILQDFNNQIASSRLYRALSYRVIYPMLFTFGMSISNIVLHRDISTTKEMKCPGSNFVMDKLHAYLKTFMMK